MSEAIQKSDRLTSRIDSVDLLRGLVMIIMVLDHVREYVHADAFHFNPTDLSKTNTLLFFTRWITHFCAPTFVFLSGTSIFLQRMRGKTKNQLAWFLLTRGAWLIVLEFTVIRFSILFNLDYHFFGFAEVIWIFGISMIALAALVYLPVWAVAMIGGLMVALHNLLDRFTIPPQTALSTVLNGPPPDTWQKLWIFLHQPGIIPVSDGVSLFVAYPILPWIGVMALGYALGTVYTWNASRRKPFLIVLSLLLFTLFIVMRAINIYGDPAPWTAQSTGLFTFLSFLNVTKYPVSLLFLLMTIGPSMLVLAAADGLRADAWWKKIPVTFGRVPLFYFILQMFYAHGAGALLGYLAGKNINHFFENFPQLSSDAPPDVGFPLWVVYVVWLGGLIVLYPICAWYARVKRGRHGFPFSYL
jgi:uncharacterized membrane protein